jgi:hypothetical protein
MVIVQRYADLFEIVFALGSPGRLAGLLHCRQQQRNQNGDDGNDDQKFNQRESTTVPHDASFRQVHSASGEICFAGMANGVPAEIYAKKLLAHRISMILDSTCPAELLFFNRPR